jgi:hypothetical protein
MSATKKILLALWLIVSLVWMVTIARPFQLGSAIDIYSSYYQKINDINDGTATSYEKKDYMESGPELEDAGKTIAFYLLAGFGLPWLLLWIGARVMKGKDAGPAPKKK